MLLCERSSSRTLLQSELRQPWSPTESMSQWSRMSTLGRRWRGDERGTYRTMPASHQPSSSPLYFSRTACVRVLIFFGATGPSQRMLISSVGRRRDDHYTPRNGICCVASAGASLRDFGTLLRAVYYYVGTLMPLCTTTNDVTKTRKTRALNAI